MLCDDFDVLCFDCDGVLWVGDVPIPGAVDTLRTLTAAGKRCFFVTNNSQYSEAEFATKFERLGFGEFVGPGALWTSVGACEHYLRQLEPANGRRGALRGRFRSRSPRGASPRASTLRASARASRRCSATTTRPPPSSGCARSS